MSLDDDVRGPKTTLVNMDTNQQLTFYMEPTVWNGSIAVNYNDIAAIGAPHAYQDYSHTSNEVFDVEFRWERIIISLYGNKGMTLEQASDEIDKQRTFLKSCTVCAELSRGVKANEPPLLFLVIPGVASVYCRILNIDWSAQKRSPKDGRMVSLTARGRFKEDPQYWATTQSVIKYGY